MLKMNIKIIMIGILLSVIFQSCSTGYYTSSCPAYCGVEVEQNNN